MQCLCCHCVVIMILQMRLLSLCIVLIIINDSVAGDPFYRSDYTFIEEVNGWMKFHRVPAPWHEARRRCVYEGAILGSPINEEFTLVMESVLDSLYILRLYTGLHATFSSGEYSTVDGIPYDLSQNVRLRHHLSYSTNLDQCAVIDSKALESVRCDTPCPYICYKKLTPLTMNVKCGTTDTEYHFENLTGHCYKVHNTPVEWSRAFTICSAEGGYLAIPSGPAESALLATLLKSKNIYMSTIGFKDWEENEEWYTVHGNPITYQRWSGKNADRAKNCAAIDLDAVFVKYYCDEKQAFICEKFPASLQKKTEGN